MKRFRKLIFELMVLAVAVAGIGYGSWATYSDLSIEPVIAIGARLRGGNVIAPPAIVGLLERHAHPGGIALCRSDILLAVGLTAVGLRDAAVRGGRPELVPATLDVIASTSREILNCSPGWGVAWTWAAIALAQREGRKDEVRAYLERSQWLSPSDYWTLAPRLQLAARVSSWYGAGFEGIIRSDIHSLLVSEVSAAEVASIVGPVYSFVDRLAKVEYAGLSDEVRRDRLMVAFGYWYANIADCDPIKFRDWLYRWQRGSCVEGKYVPQFDWKKFEIIGN